ncbi:unnamed protein product [Schistosoma curassoni]|uniref:WH2 domain-containing protein n=1 Tax=Schistosoma curassoni TaxID=6186 RepID=A0A183KAL5_9TREM|nr:unnamed protein product [Schistosoma curassoni]
MFKTSIIQSLTVIRTFCTDCLDIAFSHKRYEQRWWWWWLTVEYRVSREIVNHSSVAVSTNSSNSSSVLTTSVPGSNNNDQNNDEELAKQSESSGLAAMLQEAIAARKRNKENRCNASIRPSINSTSCNNPIISTTKSPPPPPPPAPPTLSSISQPKNDKTNPIKRTDSTQQLRKDSIDQKSSMLAEIQRRIQARRQLIDAAEEGCGLLKKDHHLEVINLSLLF